MSNRSSPKELISAIYCAILPDPTVLDISEMDVAGGVMVIVRVPPSARKFVIGRGGSTIEAIRSLLKSYSGLHRMYVGIRIPDEGSISDERASADRI